MLSLSTRILRTDLVAIDALHRQTLGNHRSRCLMVERRISPYLPPLLEIPRKQHVRRRGVEPAEPSQEWKALVSSAASALPTDAVEVESSLPIQEQSLVPESADERAW